MPAPKRLAIIAGEESGDKHAANLIKALRAKCPDLEVRGIGGDHMRAAGAELVADLAKQGVTGLTEVLRHLGTLKRAFQAVKADLVKHKPDLLILVDYPGFNLRLARFAKQKLNLTIVYYISPQIWAWKAKRIHLIKACVDHMAVILPFEKTLYEKAGVPVSFVGHPLVQDLQPITDTTPARAALGLAKEATIIALLPGSRRNEIERHAPILRQTAERIITQKPEVQFLIPMAQSLEPLSIQTHFANKDLPITFVAGQARECMAAADFVIVASGTASLECALLARPMCIIYKASVITYHAAMKLIKVRFLGLGNLLCGRMVVPEFLQDDCNAKELSRHLLETLAAPQKIANQQAHLIELHRSMSMEKSDCSLIALVENELSEKKA